MKSLVTSIAFCVFFISCNINSPEKIVESYLEKKYVPQLKDPSSYEVISTEIADTGFLADRLTRAIEYNQVQYEIDSISSVSSMELANSYKLNGYLEGEIREIKESEELSKKSKEHKRYADSLASVLPTIPSDNIDVINVVHKYKALNGLGMLAPGEVRVEYTPSTKECRIMESK